MELPALVEELQGTLGQIRQRLTETSSLLPGDRVLASDHVQVMASALSNLKRVMRRADTAAAGGPEGADDVHS